MAKLIKETQLAPVVSGYKIFHQPQPLRMKKKKNYRLKYAKFIL